LYLFSKAHSSKSLVLKFWRNLADWGEVTGGEVGLERVPTPTLPEVQRKPGVTASRG
jgi:hypothetical protein